VDWTYCLAQLLWIGLDWLSPPVCCGCEQPGYRWCPDCQNKVAPVPEPLCRTCGLLMKNVGLCPACQQDRPPYVVLRSWVAFDGPIRPALHRLKYRRNVALDAALSHPMSKFVKSLSWPVDTMVAVPLGEKRMQERGYNQEALVARPLAALTGWEYRSGALTRARETRSQVGLSASERKENMLDAFRSDPRIVSGRTILIMDDVATTGATLIACSRALLTSGAKAVYALTLARALPHHGLKIV
jgi:ComF family protein